MFTSGVNQVRPSLWLVVQEIVRSQIVAFVVFWLAVFAPVTCQYHGMMVDWFDSPPSSFMLHLDSPPGPAHVSHALQNHQMTPDVTLLMSMLTMMLPGSVVFRPAVSHTSLLLGRPIYARQRVLPPLVPPPRS